MQTFLPYANFQATARVLDYKRLGKQRVETKQILEVLLGRTTAWQTHPAVRMWRGYEWALSRYGVAICVEWQMQGYRDTLLPYFQHIKLPIHAQPTAPAWLGNPAFHAAHRAALLAKFPEHYNKYNWQETPEIKYLWPV